jgi:hypothetical protein
MLVASAGSLTVTSRKRLLSSAVLIVYALVLALGLGLGTAYLAVGGGYPFGSVRIGAWTVWPRVGSQDVDPYARAVMARNGAIPLGTGEGLVLSASVDDAGRPLDARCVYRVGSVVPPSRVWTLTVYNESEPTDPPPVDRRRGLTSAEILRHSDGTFEVTVAPEARSGNWIPMPAGGRVSLVLRLYDTPVAANSTALDRSVLPAIEQVECLP